MTLWYSSDRFFYTRGINNFWKHEEGFTWIASLVEGIKDIQDFFRPLYYWNNDFWLIKYIVISSLQNNLLKTRELSSNESLMLKPHITKPRLKVSASFRSESLN